MNGRAPIRVLFAEDDAGVRDVLSELLASDERFELVAAVANAQEAVEAAARERPDVAVVDVRMPGGGGAAATRGIRDSSRGTRVLALSALNDRATVLEMLEAGAAGYLVKGGSIGAILDSIERAAYGHASLSSEIAGEVIGELLGQLSRRRDDEARARERELRIRRVLENASAALSIVFQPIRALAGGKAVGVEALSRFRIEPERSPHEWFAEAGEVGLRIDLELLAAEAALAVLERLPGDLYLSLNVSPATVLTGRLRALLSSVDAERVVIEITEHMPVADYAPLERPLAGLRALGVRLAIDDAGAGFASLRHILQLGPEFIKLDRTLVDGIEHDRSLQALAAGLISFAARIESTIVAEGIEHDEDIEALASLGVRFGQGFLLGRPAPLADVVYAGG